MSKTKTLDSDMNPAVHIYVAKCAAIQGDHSGCDKPPIEIKTKVPFWYEEFILKRNICFGVNRNRRLVATWMVSLYIQANFDELYLDSRVYAHGPKSRKPCSYSIRPVDHCSQSHNWFVNPKEIFYLYVDHWSLSWWNTMVELKPDGRWFLTLL